MSQGRFEEVNRIMTECARVNGKELPPDLLPQLEVNSYNFFQQRTRLQYANLTAKTNSQTPTAGR